MGNVHIPCIHSDEFVQTHVPSRSPHLPEDTKHTHHLPKGPCVHVCVCVETTKCEMYPKHRSYLNIFWSPKQRIVTYRLLVVRHTAPTYSPCTSKTAAIETTSPSCPLPPGLRQSPSCALLLWIGRLRNHAVCVPLSLASFRQLNALQVHLCCC